MTKARSGQCLCGAVRLTASSLGELGACHCKMCQRWTGGPLLGVTVKESAMEIVDLAQVVSRRTSDWASRSHCGACGSPLWYRYDKGADGAGDYEVPIGLFDDANGLTLAKEIFIDDKPDSFDFAGEHKRMTKAELMDAIASRPEGA